MRNPHVRVVLDFSEMWHILGYVTSLQDWQRQEIVRQIFDYMSSDFNAFTSVIMANGVDLRRVGLPELYDRKLTNQLTLDDLGLIKHLNDRMLFLSVQIYNLVLSNGLFNNTIPNNSSTGMVFDFPFGLEHVNNSTLVLIGEGMPQPTGNARISLFE